AAALRLVQALQVEDLVVQPDDLAVPEVQVAAAREGAGVAGGGGVERAGRGRAPVDQDRLAVLVAEADAADVVGVAGTVGVRPVVDAPEAQAVLDAGERGEAPRRLLGGDGALQPGLERAAAARGRALAQRRLGPLPLGVRPRVHAGHVLLLGEELGPARRRRRVVAAGVDSVCLTESHASGTLLYIKWDFCVQLVNRHPSIRRHRVTLHRTQKIINVAVTVTRTVPSCPRP